MGISLYVKCKLCKKDECEDFSLYAYYMDGIDEIYMRLGIFELFRGKVEGCKLSDFIEPAKMIVAKAKSDEGLIRMFDIEPDRLNTFKRLLVFCIENKDNEDNYVLEFW